MERDMNLVSAILEIIVKSEPKSPDEIHRICIEEERLDEYIRNPKDLKAQVDAHLKLLTDSEHVQYNRGFGLTWKGYDLLDKIRGEQ